MKSGLILQVAVPAPVVGTFDYLLPENIPQNLVHPGARVRVSFGRQNAIGVITAITSKSDLPRNKLKPIKEIIDDEALIPQGANGTVAVYTQRGKPVHIITKVVMRMQAWLGYLTSPSG